MVGGVWGPETVARTIYQYFRTQGFCGPPLRTFHSYTVTLDGLTGRFVEGDRLVPVYDINEPQRRAAEAVCADPLNLGKL